MSETLNIILNGKIVKGNQGETVLELAQRQNIEIPTLCHDPRLEPYSSCYVCVVEIDGYRGLQPSCSTKIVEGMKITTHNDRVAKARKTALDLLVSNHYADCMGPCKQTCPAGVDVQGYISYIEKGMYHEAVALIKETNPLPAVCGRVCVRPCEVACRRNLLDEGAPVGIDYLKRFASDIDLESPNKWKPEIKPATGKKVAVIGAGPGGVSCGFFLQKEGHQVDIYEAAPKPGGWLRYGIPEYRLPNDILQKEVDNITELGVNIFYNKKLGENVSFNDIKSKYDAVILTIGSQKGTLIGCEGDDAENVFSGIDFLKEMEMSGKRYNFKGKKVAVVGGGNTAMDCCRTSIRCGADKVYVIYRRTEKEMPANPIEIHESKLEGVEYLLLTNPTRVNKTKDGKVKSVTCLKMQLGEPDASGRRRPIPVDGSEFELEVDYVLAAIGQKTNVNFLEDINTNLNGNGELKLNRWGDIDADSKTLQTGIPNVFAAGDGVTGPATLIEAIGQAKVACRSCHQFLSGLPVELEKAEFLSKRDNFKEQKSEEYIGTFQKQVRKEMPTLDPKDRLNFNEVELGYEGEEIALEETQRCMECGCAEYFTCDLKKHSTEYGAEQKKFEGEFKEYEVDFRHPFIEIDNNKCILCSRCVRICRDVVGANALGLVNRGFETYVAPSMGDKLQDTYCESCGMCISTCPTGAIAENVLFKPGPVKLDPVETICNYCSVGCQVELHHKNGYVMQTTGKNGMVNKDANICRFPKFGYNYINDNNRITKPLLKVKGRFEEISFKKAFDLIEEKVKGVKADDNVFFAGARLTNEEMYLIQKLARGGIKTNNITSFHYLNRGEGYIRDSYANVPFDQLSGASRIYLLGSEINSDNAVAGFMVNNAHKKNNVPVNLITICEDSKLEHKVDETLKIKSYYHFIKAVNYYLVSNGFQNALFIKDHCEGYEAYKEELLKENFMALIEEAGVKYMDQVIEFAKKFNNEMNAVIIFSEKEVCSAGAFELKNLAMITGKLGKTSNGLIVLKEKNNSQGLFDMGVCPKFGVGSQFIRNEGFQKQLKKIWGVEKLPQTLKENQYDSFEKGLLKNVFIFGEDPLGCAQNKVKVSGWLSVTDFVMVQDYFMTETARHANLILPASMPFEIGGSFTNTQKMIQEFDPVLESRVSKTSYDQLNALLKRFGLKSQKDSSGVMMEAIKLLPIDSTNEKLEFKYTTGKNCNRMFNYGCDVVVKRFEEQFESSLKN
ncbi:MAG: FAD-dependent oxidoreductase [Bacteroidales bacterium]|nr:FAD-dependent oxidoreductase [Bacteroidales bacterium]MCF8403030.1 FAD-dependent oxidoreductase [Bacteroidales bacterium]